MELGAGKKRSGGEVHVGIHNFSGVRASSTTKELERVASALSDCLGSLCGSSPRHAASVGGDKGHHAAEPKVNMGWSGVR